MQHLESEYSGSQLQANYFRGSTIDELVAAWMFDIDGKLKPYLFHQDQVSSSTEVSGHNGGTTQATRYSAFGQTQTSTGASPNRLKYTGREDDGTGLMYYRARYYDSSIGRFISEDPMGFGAGVNFYAYVNNNPVNANDPMGLDLVAVPLPIIGGAIKNFLFDSRIAPAAAAFVRDVRSAGIPITINLAFRTTKEQAELYNNRTNNPNPVAPPGTSRHESGFAIDVNGVDPTRGLSPGNRFLIEDIAGLYGFSTIGGRRYDVISGGRPADPPHFEANPTAYGYSSLSDAIKSNQRDYELHQLTDFSSISYSVSRDFDSLSASGGFLLYPNKRNTNQALVVYAK